MLSRQYLLKLSAASRAVTFCNFAGIQKYNNAVSYFCSWSQQKIRTVNTSSIPEINSKNQYDIKYTSKETKPLNDIKLSMSFEVLLEKMIAGLSADIHNKNRVYKNDLMRVMTKVKDMSFSTKKQGLLLLRCCADLLPDESPTTRLELAEQIWDILRSHTKFEREHFHELLKVYRANNKNIKVDTFIQRMSPVKPNNTTYELLLKGLSEAGDVNQATEVISNMKAQGLPATEEIFNSLILCQGKAGNLQNIQEILTMMKSLKIDFSVATYTALIRAMAYNKQTNFIDEMKKAKDNGIQFGETHIMEIVKTLASVGNYEALPRTLRFLPQETLNSPSISPYMQSVTTALVFQNQAIAALEIYKCLPLPSFGPKDDKGLHGRSLVRDCVKASMPSSLVGLVTQELMASGRNPLALQNASEAALQLGKIPLALDLFTRMKQIGLPLRPHYFWPILLHDSKSYGEKGIMNTLKTMLTMEVPPDYDTISQYVLPYVSFNSPQNLMKKFVEAGLTVSMVISPMMETLLNSGQVRAASELCELFQGKVDAEKILKPMLKGFLTSADTVSTVHILEDLTSKASEKNKDWTGRFLCEFMQHRKTKYDLSDFLGLLKEISKRKLRISTAAADFCISRIPPKCKEGTAEAIRNILIDLIDEKLVDDADMFVHQMPHPKTMNEESLSGHLKELEAKGMNTRGVLRKLLQKHCREGNLKAAREVVEKCEREGVFLSAGMKASIFDMHVKLGELDLAELSLAELNKSAPNFTLDEFKVIDFATLMVYREKIDRAAQLIEEQAKKRRVSGGRTIEMNCWRLLDAVAGVGTPQDAHRMFDILTSYGFCKPNNAILGPLVRVHLKNDNLQEAVNEFVRLADKYKRTPLKHELLCRILRSMSDDGQSEESFLTLEKVNGRMNKLVQTVLNVNKKVHGAGDVQLSLIAALAEVGFKQTLRKQLLEPTVRFHPDALLRRCEWFADEKKVAPLENIAVCARDLRHVDVERIYDLILAVHQRDDNCQEAVALFYRLQEADVTPSPKFAQTLCDLLRANNKKIPPELVPLLDKTTKTKVLSS